MPTPGISGTSLVSLDYIHVGSSDLTENLNRTNGKVTLERFGIPVATRVWTSSKSWNLYIAAAPQAHIEDLQAEYVNGTIKLFPDSGDTGTYYTCTWEGDFTPNYVKPGYYSLQATFRELG
jgi:hypothetical protein